MITDSRDLLAQADGFIGSILAVEGITDACTVLNGPTGCKMYLGELSHDQFRRESDHSDTRWAEEFFFGQERVPCTYLDDYDYVFGAAEKLEYVFSRVAEKGYSYVAVLNSPGASLIGDDLQRFLDWAGLKVPARVFDKPHFTEPFAVGWLDAACQTIDTLEPVDLPTEPHTVNLVGLSIWHKHWSGSAAELKRLLGLCGITVHATLLAECTVDEIRRLRRAACNVVVHDELGDGLARHLAERYDMPMVSSKVGAPLGFDATEAWVRAVCEAVGTDPAPALRHIAEARKKAAETLYRFNIKTGLPRGVGFAVSLEASMAWPLTRWLCDYLGMTPVAIQVPDDEHPMAVRPRQYLSLIGASGSWNAELSADAPPEAVFSDDAVILRLMSRKHLAVGVDLSMPAKDVTHFISRAVLGPAGALWLLESLCNGLWQIVDEEAAHM